MIGFGDKLPCEGNPQAPGVGQGSELSELKFPHLGNREEKTYITGVQKEHRRKLLAKSRCVSSLSAHIFR